MARLIDADLFMQRIESYNTLDEMDKALHNFALHEIVCMPTVDVLEQIRAEIKQMDTLITRSEVLEVIDKYLD